MKVIIDRAIPYIEHVLEPYALVEYYNATEITPKVVNNADALIIRTRTKCNKELLEGSNVRFIATATIGLDHIDQTYCNSHGIKVCSAPGCNARGVLQWVAAALRHITYKSHKEPCEFTLGVIGVGNVGSLVAKYARHWGFKVMECDPPRQAREGGEFYSLNEIMRHCNIITLHTPLDDSTYHLINSHHLISLRPGTVIINASRGAVIDNNAILKSNYPYIFDVWEDEPYINEKLILDADIATPHIAGYSVQGKANATAMSIRSLSHHFRLPLTDWYPDSVTPTTPRLISWQELCETMPKYYNIDSDSKQLKVFTKGFEQLRNNYNYREEYF